VEDDRHYEVGHDVLSRVLDRDPFMRDLDGFDGNLVALRL
jgi:hypothetical protein